MAIRSVNTNSLSAVAVKSLKQKFS